MKRSTRLALSLAGLALSILLASCSGVSSGTPAQPIITVSVTQSGSTVQAGNTIQLTATVANDSAHYGVTWTVSCATSPCGKVLPTTTASGAATTYTAPPTPPANDLTVTISATSLASPTAIASAVVTVSATKVSITQSATSVQARGTVQLTATVTGDPMNKGVTWTVSCSPAPCGKVLPTTTASGAATTYEAPPTPPASLLTVTISATSVFNTAVSSFTQVTVSPVTVSVTPVSALLPLNTALQFTATVADDPGNKGVNWMATQGGTACSPSCGTVAPTSTASGKPTSYTAPKKMPATSAVTLTATSVTDGTKTGTAAITPATGTVQLVPYGLDFGSSPQSITLTNTGGAALSITSITITGANAGHFSQTNTCGSGVGAGMSCAITVTFKPPTSGSLWSASISIVDSSPDSPQQVSLVAMVKGKGFTDMAAVRSTLASAGTMAVPIPTGPETVGTRVLQLVDSTRQDPFLGNGAKRELLVRFWYPASLTEACKPADYTQPRVWAYFSQLAGVHLPEVITNSCLDAPMTDGVHPMVVLTHGYTGTFTDYTFIAEDLASRGYVVASVNHTYEATAVEFPDGRFVKSRLGSHLGNTWRGDYVTLTFATSVRLQDLRFLLLELERLNTKSGDAFAGKLDMSRIAIAGHSLGGTTAFLALEQDARFRAAIVLDGYFPAALIHPTQMPVLVLNTGRMDESAGHCRLWNSLRGPRVSVNLSGAEHVAPSDAVWLAKGAIETGSMGPERTVAAIRDHVAAFLDTNLRGRPLDPLLTGPSASYPDAVAGTQGQSLCREP